MALALAASLLAPQALLASLVNGNFEAPVISSSPWYQTHSGGTLTGWTVTAGNVDLLNGVSYLGIVGAAAQGNQYLDLNGAAPGTISQQFATVPGTNYVVTFMFADNYTAPSGGSSATVKVSDSSGTRFIEPIQHDFSVPGNFYWQMAAIKFTAVQALTTIEFASTTVPSQTTAGILLDDVKVEPAAPFQQGWAVGTCFSGADYPGNTPDSNGYVMGRMETNAVTVTGAANNMVPMYHHPEWKRSRMGEIFGVTLDDQPVPNTFVSATAVYNSSFHPAVQYNQWPAAGVGDTFGTWGEPGGIYRVDGLACTVCNYARVPNVGTSAKGQTASLGNICFDKKRRLLYVSNLDDGGIYSVPWIATCPSSPLVAVKVFDHGTQGRPIGGLTVAGKVAIADPIQIPSGASAVGITPAGRRVWGLQTWNDRLYYGVWNGGTTSQSASSHSEIWSVALDAAGAALPATTKLEIKVLAQSSAPVYMPISDISFTPGGVMLIAERGSVVATAPVATAGILAGMVNTLYPHDANIYQYRLTSGGSWTQGNKFKVGNTSQGDNSAGGIDMDCDETVLATGNALASQSSPFTGYYYGLQITPHATNPAGNFALPDPISQSHLIDYDGITAPGLGIQAAITKTTLGDIALIRRDCPCIHVVQQQTGCKDGKARWTVTFTNTWGIPIGYIALDHITGGATVPSLLIPVTPALQPGESRTQIIDFTVPPNTPQICFDFIVHNTDLSTCCATNFCINPDLCICIEPGTEIIRPRAGGGLEYCIRLTNLSGLPASRAEFTSNPPGSVCPIFPNWTTTFPSVPHGGSVTVCVPVIIPAGCTSLNFNITLRTSQGEFCCSVPRSLPWCVAPNCAIAHGGGGAGFPLRVDVSNMLAEQGSHLASVKYMVDGVEASEVVNPPWGFGGQPLTAGVHRVRPVLVSHYGFQYFGQEVTVDVSTAGIVTPQAPVVPFALNAEVIQADRSLALWWDDPAAVLQTTQNPAGVWDSLPDVTSGYIHTDFSDGRRFFRLWKP